jgi:putative peptidoglycan lipid II flippase
LATVATPFFWRGGRVLDAPLKVDTSAGFGKWGGILDFPGFALGFTIVAMAAGKRHPLLTDTVVTSAGTLTSRVLGFVRDMATAALFGLSTGGVLDALVVAFRIPNLFRALFGEGALTASFLPVFTEALEHNRETAWQVLRDTTRWLARVLIVITLAGEIVLGIWAWLANDDSRIQLLLRLTAIFLPYLIIVCLTALASATLQVFGRFASPAFTPALLNICWIFGALLIAPAITSEATGQASILAVCVLIGGLLPGLAQWWSLRREGFRFRSQSALLKTPPGTGSFLRSPRSKNVPVPFSEVGFSTEPSQSGSIAASQLKRIQHGMIPTTLALAVTQLNTLSDSIVAWALAAPVDGPQTISWLGNVRYPMEQGAAATIYFGERLYQFPLGLIGIAVATVVFPLLSKHCSRGDRAALAADLTFGLRLTLWAAVPSAVGLVVLAQPITRLLFQHGQFTVNDTLRAARMIAMYGAGVWAYCALPVLVRGFYAADDRQTPLRVALVTVALNLALDFTLIWPLAEVGLAAATVISATVQLTGLAVLFSRLHVPLQWRPLIATLLRSTAAAIVMAGVIVLVLGKIAVADDTWNAVLRVIVPTAAGMATYAAVIVTIEQSLWRKLVHRG